MNNMSQNQPKRAIAVIPSDTINIPQPGAYYTSFSAFALRNTRRLKKNSMT